MLTATALYMGSHNKRILDPGSRTILLTGSQGKTAQRSVRALDALLRGDGYRTRLIDAAEDWVELPGEVSLVSGLLEPRLADSLRDELGGRHLMLLPEAMHLNHLSSPGYCPRPDRIIGVYDRDPDDVGASLHRLVEGLL